MTDNDNRVSLDELTNIVGSTAQEYENALKELQDQASSGTSTLDLSQTTKQTVVVQTKQAITEMAQSVVKSGTDQIKGQGKRIGG